MSEGGLARARLLRLCSELSHERVVAERLAAGVLADADRLARGAPGDPTSDGERGAIAVVAVGLHRWYSALESMIERIERSFGTLPVGPEWRAELLVGAAWEIPGVRPAIVPREHLDPLRELLKVRHFFRHAYAVELDRPRLLVLADDLRAVHAPVLGAMQRFEAFLVRTADALGTA